MHQRIAALFASFAVTSLVMLIGWNLAISSQFGLDASPTTSVETITPPALQAVSAVSNDVVAANESIASR